ncbi:hypothetical protein LEP3755_13600 [Leptolyngbya sp. NIES-3755]|nr:hypothetical protein LEP3755_13600 [Leptolyngbya sp. NIES-3755]
MTRNLYIENLERLESHFRRFGIEGDIALQVIAYSYIQQFNLGDLPEKLTSKFGLAYAKIQGMDELKNLINEVVSKDPLGQNIHSWYQFFISRKFREGSGKFFTPVSIASAMVSLIPEKEDAIIMDPTCGGGIFLIEIAKRWKNRQCTLVANDIDPSLIELTLVALSLNSQNNHKKHFICTDVFQPDLSFERWYGKVDYILANPPFSLRINSEKFVSPLSLAGYRSSDALFLDIVEKLLKPGGRIVCLLPHSIITNKEFSNLREIVEQYFYLVGIVSLPEGIFYMSAGTSTRADIIVLQKKSIEIQPPTKVIFASVPSVGFNLNTRVKNSVKNDLDMLIQRTDVQEAFGVV